MTKEVKTIEEIVEKSREFIDCFISMDAIEANHAILKEIKLGNGDDAYRNGVITLTSDNLSLSEALAYQQFGFIPMSRIRISASRIGNKSSLVNKTLVPILERLRELKQNMIFTNDFGTVAYVELSEFYR